jgi:hypothetical protein
MLSNSQGSFNTFKVSTNFQSKMDLTTISEALSKAVFEELVMV